MRKLILFIILILFTTIALSESATGFYWYRTSEGGQDVGTFVQNGEQDPGYWYTGDWVLFAVSGDVEVTNDSTIKGIKGWKIGSNSSSLHPFVITGNPHIYTEDFWVGPGMTGETGTIMTKNWWKWQPGPLQDFYYRRLPDQDINDKVNNPDEFFVLPALETFEDPSKDFPLLAGHFAPEILNKMTYKENLTQQLIKLSTHYKNFNIASFTQNQTVTIRIGEDDIVLLIDNLTVGDNSRILIEQLAGVEEYGSIFFFVKNANQLSNTIIGNKEFMEKTFVFYSGASALTVSGTGQIYGNVYILNSDLYLNGSGGAKEIVSIAGKTIYCNSNDAFEIHGKIFAKIANVIIDNDNPLTKGIVTGGEKVEVRPGNKPSFVLNYIYAPNADLIMSYDSTFEGSFIGNTVTVNNTPLIQGPPITRIKKPTIPQPEIPSYYDGEWLTNYDVKDNRINLYYPVANVYGEHNRQIEFDSNDDINIVITSSKNNLPINVSINGYELGPWELRQTKNKKIQTEDILKLFKSAPNAAPHDMKAVNIHNLPQNYEGKITINYKYDNQNKKDPQFNPIWYKIKDDEEKYSGGAVKLVWENGIFIE